MPDSLFHAAARCLAADTPEAKLALTRAAFLDFSRGGLPPIPVDDPPAPIAMPGRPPRPRLVPVKALPQRGLGSAEGRAAFLHAIAHIEFNAIDLAWDAVYRFRDLPLGYYADWVRVADDEARHFGWLQARLLEMGYAYGDFDAHNGLWDMAMRTADSLSARMALVPRVLEARGLDVTPGMIARLRACGDEDSVAILQRILDEEVAHVAAGSRWFRHACEREGCNPRQRFEDLLREHALGALRGPFNREARLASGFEPEELDWLDRLAGAA
jgi:uncharacterized ferritin-like protein (DUF455 family)